MDKYSVELEFTHEFDIDLKGLCEWADSTLNLKTEQYTEGWIIFSHEGELTEDETEEYKSDEHKQLKEYYDALTEEGEAAKLSQPSRLKGTALRDWQNSKKAEIASETDYSQLTEAQKKLWMGLELTDAEKDGLGA